MSGLYEFLRDRLADDEAVAEDAADDRRYPEWEASESVDGDQELLVALRPGLPRPPDVMSGYWGAVFAVKSDDADQHAWSPMPALNHAARHDPARVLAEVTAKRQILELHRDGDAWCDHCSGWYGPDPAAECPTLRALAQPYADHQDFRKEWRDGAR